MVVAATTLAAAASAIDHTITQGGAELDPMKIRITHQVLVANGPPPQYAEQLDFEGLMDQAYSGPNDAYFTHFYHTFDATPGTYYSYDIWRDANLNGDIDPGELQQSGTFSRSL